MIYNHYTGPLIASRGILDHCKPQLAAMLGGSSSDDGKGAPRMDASNIIIGATSALEKVLQKVVGYQFPEISWRNIFAEGTDRSPGIETLSWAEERGGGKYAPYASGAALQKPNKGGKKRTIYSVSHAMAMGWGHDEMLRAAVLGQDLSAKDGILVRRAYEERVEECVWLGDPSYQITGLLTDSAVKRVKLTKNVTPTSGGIADTTALKLDGTDSSTAAEIETALLKFVALVGRNTNEVWKESGTLVVPPAAYRHLTQTDLSLNPTLTIAESFTKKTGIQIAESYRLVDVPAALTGLAAAQQFFALVPKDPMVAEVQIPSPLQIFAAQISGLETLVPTYAEIAGLAVYEPNRILTGYY